MTACFKTTAAKTSNLGTIRSISGCLCSALAVDKRKKRVGKQIHESYLQFIGMTRVGICIASYWTCVPSLSTAYPWLCSVLPATTEQSRSRLLTYHTAISCAQRNKRSCDTHSYARRAHTHTHMRTLPSSVSSRLMPAAEAAAAESFPSQFRLVRISRTAREVGSRPGLLVFLASHLR